MPVMGAAIAPPVFLVDRVCELLDATFAYCVQHRTLHIMYFIIKILCVSYFAFIGDEGVGGKMLKALDLSYLNFKSKHILVALRTCILFLYIIIYSSLLERLGL